MANQPQNLDKLFEEKLSQHQVKPSKLAWERLESQLPKKQKKEPKIYWWAAAAAILVLIVSYSVFQNTDQTSQPEFVAEETTTSNNTPEVTPTPQETIASRETPAENTDQVESTDQSEINNSAKSLNTTPKPVKEEITSEQFIAEAEDLKQEKEEQIITEIPEIEIPAIVIDRPLIADATMEIPSETEVPTEAAVEEPAYKLTIISDGIKDEKDKSLIAGIGKRVNQVEGLLGKVDEGFGEIQDAKNNLFSSLISKRDRTADKPQ